MKDRKWTKDMGITCDDAMRLSREFLERVHTPKMSGLKLINHCRDIISLGIKALEVSKISISFSQAVEISLDERSERRSRTIGEIRCICSRLMKNSAELSGMTLRDMNTEYCKKILENNFHTSHQYVKARSILYSIFSCGMRHGWCSSNPIEAIPRPILCETEIIPLSWDELQNLLQTAHKTEYESCLPAVGIMLWAGVRPAELMRLNWEDIDWQEKIINLRPKHTKTGGCRHITLHSVLIAWLKNIKNVKKKTGPICPRNWSHKWKALRAAAGIHHWQQDVLRHTFASYHLKYWHDTNKLQEEMGHRSAYLLQTRYLSMKGITQKNAKLFWTPGKLG